MFEIEYQRSIGPAVTDSRREQPRLHGTVLSEEDLEDVAGGCAHIGEEIPQ